MSSKGGARSSASRSGGSSSGAGRSPFSSRKHTGRRLLQQPQSKERGIRVEMQRLRHELLEALEDENEVSSAEDIAKNNLRAADYAVSVLRAALTDKQQVDVALAILKHGGYQLTVLDTTALAEQVMQAVKAGSSSAPAAAEPRVAETGRVFGIAINNLSRLVLPFFAHLPGAKHEALDPEKFPAYKAAFLLFSASHPDVTELDFRGKLAAAVSCNTSRVSAEIRSVVFQSFKESVTRIQDQSRRGTGDYKGCRDQHCSMSLAELADTLYDSWVKDALEAQGPGTFANKAFLSLRRAHKDPGSWGVFRTVEDIFERSSEKFDKQVTEHIMYTVVNWGLEVLQDDLVKFNEDAAEEHQGSDEETMGPAEDATYEAPGFRAIARFLDFIDKYRKPAYRKPAPGGGRSAAAAPAKRARKAKTQREYLDTRDNQRFNDELFFRLGECTSTRSRRKQPEGISTYRQAEVFFRPYLSPAPSTSVPCSPGVRLDTSGW
ncbi:unnamed protein product [Scytosiphon promiscuus]